MKASIKAAWITGLLGLAGTVSAAIIGNSIGKSTEQRNIQNQMNEVMGDMVNVIGDGNNVTINDIKEVLEDYLDLKTQNESLLAQNTKYFDDLTKANKEIDQLHMLSSEEPSINFTNLAMSIDGEDMLVNQNNSMVTINGRDYMSKELFEKIIPDNKSITIKNDMLIIGRNIAEQASLFNQWIVDQSSCSHDETYTDSFGHTYSNSISLRENGSHIIFNLDNKYKYLKLGYAADENTNLNEVGTIIVKADDNIVYTSSEIAKTNDFNEIMDIDIKNCSLLKLEYSITNSWHPCIISDAVVYN